ncbi:MAG: DUF547 domain-containing protein [Gemmatimonadota bacterium]|nr:MAG: DUF547 domain-containing protein [Gemmatimonadota bacterium]
MALSRTFRNVAWVAALALAAGGPMLVGVGTAGGLPETADAAGAGEPGGTGKPAGTVEPAQTAEPAPDAWPDHSAFDELLQRYVSDAGVDYAAWHANAGDRERLRTYLQTLSAAPVSELQERANARPHALAYWLNLYNAVTLNFVLDGYPTDSIKDLGGMFSSPWKKKLVTVEGTELTLNEIENDIIRPRFREPRIHFALNCAAVSCPPLRAGAYVGESLDQQLEEQTVRFLADPRANRVGDNGRLRLSKIFDWYADDFRDAAGSVAQYVAPYLKDYPVDTDGVRIESNDYDWTLNDAGRAGS